MRYTAVYLDDAEHARRRLEPLLSAAPAPAHWLMVGCAPRLSHRVGKWVSHSSREHWRQKWLQRLRSELEPALAQCQPQVHFEWTVARAPLEQVWAQLRQQHGDGLQLVDARRERPAPGQVLRGLGLPWALGSGLWSLAALAD